MVESIEGSATMRVTHTQEARMRGDDRQQAGMWSYLSPEQRVPVDHPLRPLRAMVGRGHGRAVGRIRQAVCAGGPTVDRTREVAPRPAAAGAVQRAERAAADGAARLQLAVPLVCRLEHGT